jgi:hypothetical protein
MYSKQAVGLYVEVGAEVIGCRAAGIQAPDRRRRRDRTRFSVKGGSTKVRQSFITALYYWATAR